MINGKPQIVLFFVLICGLFLYACDALVSSGDTESNPTLPDGERNLELLTETQWISLPDQKIMGKEFSPRWHIITWRMDEELMHGDIKASGRHYFVMNDRIMGGNGFLNYFDLESNGNLKPHYRHIVGVTYKLVPVSEVFGFLHVVDWVITDDKHLYVKYPHYDDGSTEMFIYIFEPYTEEHDFRQKISDYEE